MVMSRCCCERSPCCVISVADKLVRHLLRFSLGAAEYDAVDARIIVDDALQCQVFVLGIHHIIYVVDVLCALIARANHYFLVVMQVATRNLLYLLTHRSREEQRIAVLRNILENLIDTVGETHVKHLVSLVKHHVAHGFQLGSAASDEVDEASRCGYDNLLMPLIYFANDLRSSAICRHNSRVGEITMACVARFVGSVRCRSGMPKAAVFPVPGCERAMTSLPSPSK